MIQGDVLQMKCKSVWIDLLQQLESKISQEENKYPLNDRERILFDTLTELLEILNRTNL
jgi:hypothetical protein